MVADITRVVVVVSFGRVWRQNEKATEDTFRGGWLNTGDLAVQQANGRIQIRDRSKDVIIRWGRPGQEGEGEGVVSCKALVQTSSS